MSYDPDVPLSPQAQFLRNRYGAEGLAKDLYRITNGQVDWRTDKSEQAQADWNNGPMQGPPGKAYAEYLKEALRNHPDAPRLQTEAKRVLTPVSSTGPSHSQKPAARKHKTGRT